MISKHSSYVWLRDFLIVQADTGVRFTTFGIFSWRTPDGVHSAPADELPDELYIGFVDGLLVDVAPVFLSALTATFVQIVIAIACRSTLLFATSAAQPAIAAIRLFHLHRLAKQAPSRTLETARR